jgi:DNA-binding CsgD family transcriptional regulator
LRCERLPGTASKAGCDVPTWRLGTQLRNRIHAVAADHGHDRSASYCRRRRADRGRDCPDGGWRGRARPRADGLRDRRDHRGSIQAALDEATDLTAHPDRFTETVMRHWRARLFATLGQLEAAETELGLCRAAGRSGAVRLVEFLGPICEARLAAARGDATAAVGALRRAADAGRRVGSVMFVPAALAALACMAAIGGDEAAAAAAVDEATAELGGRRQAITTATLRYAEGVMAWHRGELADAEHLAREATMQWHRGCDRMDACDGIEFLGVLAAARERFSDAARLLAAADAARRPLQYLAPGFTANRDAAAHAASQARNVLGDDCFTQAWDEGQGFTLDDAVAYAARRGGGRKRPAAGWASLTPAELQVARLVGEGLRNDAIARRLFIAPGTVKVHLTHIFAKLGITTRAELAAQAAAQDLTARSDGLPRSPPRRDTGRNQG